MIAFLWWLVPLLVSTYNVPGMQLGRWLQVLERLRASLPYWVLVPPALAAFVVVWCGWRRGVRGRPRRQRPDRSHRTNRLRYAQFAEICAELLQSGTPKSAAIELAAGACGGLPASIDARATRSAGRSDAPSRSDEPNASSLPPLLTYALASGLPDADCSLALRAASISYRQMSLNQQERFQRVLPLLLLIVVGGGVVLLYGLMLFLPLAELLETLSSPF
jgi:type II secretory pathway component PulF